MFRPAVGGWYVNGQATQFLGLSSDTPCRRCTPASGLATIGVYRPAVGGWYVSGEGDPVPRVWRATSPCPPTTSGSNVAQIGVYRPTVGAWYLAGQATQFLGAPGDVPLDIPYAIRHWHCSINAC